MGAKVDANAIYTDANGKPTGAKFPIFTFGGLTAGLNQTSHMWIVLPTG
jgi:hypothetical protein